MAGSFNHCVDYVDGKLILRNPITGSLDHLGDASEAIEEMFHMIMHLSQGDLKKIKEAQDAYYYTTYPHFKTKGLTRWLNELNHES